MKKILKLYNKLSDEDKALLKEKLDEDFVDEDEPEVEEVTETESEEASEPTEEASEDKPEEESTQPSEEPTEAPVDESTEPSEAPVEEPSEAPEEASTEVIAEAPAKTENAEIDEIKSAITEIQTKLNELLELKAANVEKANKSFGLSEPVALYNNKPKRKSSDEILNKMFSK